VRGIEAALSGVAGTEPELKTSKAGKPYCSFSVGVDAGEDDEGKERLEWVRCTCFGPVAERLAATLHKGEKLYAEGGLRLDRWDAKDGQQRFGLSMACFKAEKIGSSAIGKNRPKTDRQYAQAERAPIPPSSFAGPAQFEHRRQAPQIQGRDRFDFDDEIPFGRG
jgi:single-strand DNA-binding protein